MKTNIRIAVALIVTCSYFFYSCASENPEIMDDVTITATIDEVTSKYAVATIEFPTQFATIYTKQVELIENETGERIGSWLNYDDSEDPRLKIVMAFLKPNTAYTIVPWQFPIRVKNGEFRTLPAKNMTSDIPAHAKLEVLEATPTSVRVRVDAVENYDIGLIFYDDFYYRLYYSKSKEFEDAKYITLYNNHRDIRITNLEPDTKYYYRLEGRFGFSVQSSYSDSTIIYPLEDNATFSTALDTADESTE